MVTPRRTQQAGILVAISLLGAAAWPYLTLPEEAWIAVGEYYAQGLFGLIVVLFLAVVAIVILAAGLRERTDPATVAGATVGIGTVMAILAIEWAVAVHRAGGVAFFTYHPWIVAGISLLLPAIGLLHARRIGLV